MFVFIECDVVLLCNSFLISWDCLHFFFQAPSLLTSFVFALQHCFLWMTQGWSIIIFLWMFICTDVAYGVSKQAVFVPSMYIG